MTKPEGPEPLVIVFMPTLACDCACDYCFVSPSAPPGGLVDWDARFGEMADLAEALGMKRLLVHWQGGEISTLGTEEVERGRDAAEALFARRGLEAEHRLQTNLAGWNASWADIVRRRFGARASSSLDWPNLYRHARGGGAEEFGLRWMASFRAAREAGIEVGVIAVVNEGTIAAGAEAFYSWYETAGIRRLQVNLPFPGRRGAAGFPIAVDFAAVADFMADLRAAWIGHGRAIELSPFAQIEARAAGRPAGLPCIWSEDCSRRLIAIGPEGQAAQCDCWLASHPDRSFGSLPALGAAAILGSAARAELAERPAALLEREACGLCRHWSLCHGGCPVRAFSFTGRLDLPDPYCPVYLGLFDLARESASMSRNASSARVGR